MIDAKRAGRGQLRVEQGKTVQVTPSGERRPMPQFDNARAYSRAGALYDLTQGKTGLMVWVFPDEVDYTHPSVIDRPRPRAFRKGGLLLSLSELRSGALEQVPELPTPYQEADPGDIARLEEHTWESIKRATPSR